MPLAQLPSSTIKLIGSSQVITSVSSVIKELMENSIDSGAHNIEIKLDKHGLEKIEIKDDGCGIGKSDAMVMCLAGYTSKISDFSDLDKLSSYGFRGEALSSLCNVAQVCVTTKTAEDEVATCFTYDHNGQVTCSKLSHITKGTIVTVTDLFKSLPVRKQFVSSSRRAAEELKNVEKIVKSLAIVHPRLRVTLVHNKFRIWQKTSVTNLRQSVMQILSHNIVTQLHHILHNTQDIRIEMLVPKCDCDVASLSFSKFSDASYLFINKRPVRNKEIEKMVYSKMTEYFGVYVPANKYPVCVVCLTVPADCLDVNLEPNKTRVYFKNQDDVFDIVKQCLHIYYGDQQKETAEDKLPAEKLSRKRKGADEYQEVDSKKVNLAVDFKPGSSEDSDGNGLSVTQSTISTESTSQPDYVTITDTSVALIQQYADDIFENFCLERESIPKENMGNEPLSNNEMPTSIESEKNCTSKESPTYSSFFNHESKESCTLFEDKDVRSGNINQKSITNKNNKTANNDINLSLSKERNNLLRFFRKDSDETAGLTRNTTESHEYEQDESPNPDMRKNGSTCAQDPVSHFNGSRSDADDVEIMYEHTRPAVHCRSDAEVSAGFSSPTLSQWSRGEITSVSGEQVKGSCVFTSVPGAASPLTSQALSNRSVSSQMGCKEMSAFTKFARNMRKQILEEQPDMSFTRVAQLLQVQWRNLNEEDKKKYEEIVTVKKVQCLTSSQKQQTLSMSMAGQLKKQPDIELDVDMNSIKQMVKISIWKEREDNLVGQLSASHLWLYCAREKGLTVFSVSRMMEAIKFHQHLTDFALPVKLLNDPIPFSSRDVGESQWNLLLMLERSPNGVVKDPLLVNNGFVVEILGGEVEAQITYVPQNISFFGVEELQEVLNLLQRHGPQASLAQTRPLKVVSFIRSEVMRECSQQELPTQFEQVAKLLSNWLSHVAPHTQCCIHYKPVTSSLPTI